MDTASISAEPTITHIEFEPFSLVEAEGGRQNLRLAPIDNSSVRANYWWNHEPYQGDFNGDGFLDVIYAGVMKPEYSVVAETTGGICGGGRCKGDLAQPVLYLGQSNTTLRNSTQLLVDNRAQTGNSLGHGIIGADFNQDGRTDFYISDTGVGTHNGFRDSYFLSQPDGTWLESSQSHLSDPNLVFFNHGSTAGDIDNDGDIDIVNTNLNGTLTCWVNQGDARMRKKTCGSVFAFAIELADMNGDGYLDVVHGAHEFEGGSNSATGVSYNNRSGSFGRTKKLKQIPEWGTIPELSVKDLDGDGDQDIILSRTRKLYVGTALEIKENLGNGRFASSLHVLFDGPEDYRPISEGNEYNNFIQAIRFLDQDDDGDIDILILANEQGRSGSSVAGAIFRNDGNFSFVHLPYGSTGNNVRRISPSAFH